jgi:transcriptional regulator with XRE-family HTH domain
MFKAAAAVLRRPQRALRDELFAQGKTQRDVALAAGIPEVRFSAIIRGRTEPTLPELKAIAKVLRRPIEQLFGADVVAALAKRQVA